VPQTSMIKELPHMANGQGQLQSLVPRQRPSLTTA